MAFQCSGCGESRPISPSLHVHAGTVHVDDESRRIDAQRFCAACVPGALADDELEGLGGGR